MAPLPHLLAAPGSMHGGQSTTVSGEHGHAGHQAGATTSEYQAINTGDQADTACQGDKSCKFCLAVIATNQSSQDFVRPDGYVASLNHFISTSLFPELRPPRQS